MIVIGPVRNSKYADDDSSPERQKRHIDARAASEGATVLTYPTDLDVSAMKYSPFERPQIGPWMTDPEKLSRYDGIIFWRWDRFVRNGQDMRDVFTWARKYNKTIISASEGISYNPTETDPIKKIISELMIMMVTAFAEIEVTNASTRFRDQIQYLRDEGRPLGGTPPFGMEPGIDERGKRNWVVSERTQPIVLEIVRRLREGESRAEIASDFNAREVLTPKNWARVFRDKPTKPSQWNTSTIGHIFNSDALLGYRVKGDPAQRSRRVTVRDADGNPVVLCAPVLARPDGSPDVELLREVQRLMAGPQRRIGRGDELKNPIAGVVRCYSCGKALNATNPKTRGVIRRYLMCRRAYTSPPECDSRGLVPLQRALDYIETLFLARYGDDHVVERTYVQGNDRSAELAELREAIDAVSLSLESARNPETIRRQTARLDQLATQISDIERSPDLASGWRVRELEETNKEVWESSDWEARREMLIRAGISIRMKREPRTERMTVAIDEL